MKGEKKMRSDGEQNKKALLAAAAKLFHSEGFDVPFELIAKEAGVTRTTIYRNFPDRLALGMAIFEDNIVVMEKLAKEVKGQEDGFFTLLYLFRDKFVESSALTNALQRQTGGEKKINEMRRRLEELLKPLLVTAKAAKLIQSYITPSDISLIIQMLVGAIDNGDDNLQRAKKSERAMKMLLSGISTTGK